MLRKVNQELQPGQDFKKIENMNGFGQECENDHMGEKFM